MENNSRKANRKKHDAKINSRAFSSSDLQEQLSDFCQIERFIYCSPQEGYGTRYVLIRMLEDWKIKLGSRNNIDGFIPHDLLIAKLHPYGFDENSLIFINSYLKWRRKSLSKTMFIATIIQFYQGFLRDWS